MNTVRIVRRFFPFLFIFATAVSIFSTDSAQAASDDPVCYGIERYSVETIKQVQKALGVYVDGQFGPRSCEQLIVFQVEHSPPLMDSSGNFGRLGPKTLAALGVAAQPAQLAANSIPVNSGSGKRVIVDQTANMVYLVSGNGTLVASGGMVDNPSMLPKGTYAIGWETKVRIIHNGEIKLENFKTFYGNVGFHKIPITVATGQRFHSENLLGTNQRDSSGCIRLGSTFSDQLWVFASVGTKVVVI